MIEYVTLRNFQRHKKLKVEFAKGVTTLVGPTNAGKSAVIRALRLALLNRPNGNSQISHGKDALKVEVGFDHITLIRTKGKKVNSYKLEEFTFKAFGAGKVPKDISDQLKVTDNNFQRQFDPAFWFTESPGQISRNLNKIVDLSVIDRSLAAVTKEVRVAKAEEEVARRRHHAARIKRNELKWVGEMLPEWRALEELRVRAEELAKKRANLNLLLANAQRHSRAQQNFDYARQAGEKALETGWHKGKVQGRRHSLQTLIAKAKDSKRLVGRKLPDLSPVQVLRKKGDEVAERRRNLEVLVQHATKMEESLCQSRKLIAAAEEKLKKLSPALCPACGQPMKSSLPRLATCTSH